MVHQETRGVGKCIEGFSLWFQWEGRDEAG